MSVIVTTNEAIAAALADVIDENLGGFQWMWSTQETYADALRLDFRDAVLKRLGELHVAPHSMAPHLENLCERHRKEALPKPTVGFCGSCERELKAKLGHSEKKDGTW